MLTVFKRILSTVQLSSFKAAEMSKNGILCLFDVDGTLTAPRKNIDESMLRFLMDSVKSRCKIGVVGGSDLSKITDQLGGKDSLKNFDFVFAENGLIAFKDGVEIGRESIQKHMGEERLQKFINYTLRYLSEIELPVKRGTFIEFRTGLINVSPIGRSCSREERDQFEQYDKEHKIRAKFVQNLQKQFPDLGLTFSIGGQISFDVFPTGWDKRFCLKFIDLCKFDEIHFFGDKTDEGGNDFEIFNDPRVIGHRVYSPEDTKKKLQSVLSV